jgi:hypothetical protein
LNTFFSFENPQMGNKQKLLHESGLTNRTSRKLVNQWFIHAKSLCRFCAHRARRG